MASSKENVSSGSGTVVGKPVKIPAAHAEKAREMVRDARIRRLEVSADKVPAGFYTAKEWADAWGISDRHVSEAMGLLVEDGFADVEKFRVVDGERIIKVKHWKLKNGEKP